jgi:hypothetical protein
MEWVRACWRLLLPEPIEPETSRRRPLLYFSFVLMSFARSVQRYWSETQPGYLRSELWQFDYS